MVSGTAANRLGKLRLSGAVYTGLLPRIRSVLTDPAFIASQRSESDGPGFATVLADAMVVPKLPSELLIPSARICTEEGSWGPAITIPRPLEVIRSAATPFIQAGSNLTFPDG